MAFEVRINVSQIKDQVGQALEISRKIKIPESDGVIFENPWQLEGQVNHTNSGYYLDLMASGKVNTICDRCLERFAADMRVEIRENFLPKDQSRSVEERTFEGDEIDLSATLGEAIILAFPMKWLCQKECKGLCPVCGVNKNLTSCDCKEEKVDIRLAKLMDWKDKFGGESNG